MGVPVWLYRDALSAGRRLPGLYTNTHTLYTGVCGSVCVYVVRVCMYVLCVCVFMFV